jgi:hypothetical protein
MNVEQSQTAGRRRQVNLWKVDGANCLAIVDVGDQLGGHVNTDGRLCFLGRTTCRTWILKAH